MGTVVGISAAGEASVGGVSVDNAGTGVSVGRRGADVGAGEEQEMSRKIQKTVSRTRVGMCWGIRVF